MKRLAVCLDGTWNTQDQQHPTNVVKMAEAIAEQDGETPQLVFYDAGVGTGQSLFDRLTGGAFGRGLSENVRDGYRWLAEQYNDGDEIYVFGYSRGAYTARSLVGLIGNVGLLRPRFNHRLDEAYGIYREKEGGPDSTRAMEFREAFAREVRVAFLGVWDTVGSLGIPGYGLRWLTRRRHGFHDVRLSRTVDSAWHAVAIDERRRPFKPTLWETTPDERQTVGQAWFPGVHGNVGGGKRQTGLSDGAFEWIRAAAEERGLAFDRAYLERTIRPDSGDRVGQSTSRLMRLLGEYLRPIGESEGPEVLSDAALEKVATDPGYRPENLVEYFNERGWPGGSGGG